MRLKSKVGREFEGQVNIFCNAAGYNNHFIYNLSLNSVYFKHKDNILLRYIIDMLVDFWLKSLGTYCLHCVLGLSLFETNSKNKQVPDYKKSNITINKFKNTIEFNFKPFSKSDSKLFTVDP